MHQLGCGTFAEAVILQKEGASQGMLACILMQRSASPPSSSREGKEVFGDLSWTPVWAHGAKWIHGLSGWRDAVCSLLSQAGYEKAAWSLVPHGCISSCFPVRAGMG